MAFPPASLRPITVVMVDDDPAAMNTLTETLAAHEIHIVAHVGGVHTANHEIDTLGPDVVFVEVDLPLMPGPVAASAIKEAHPEVVVIAMTNNDTSLGMSQMLEAGVNGYIMKGTDPLEIRGLLDRALRGQRVYCQTAIALLEHALPDLKRQDRSIYINLKPEEQEVVDLIILGLSNDEIAEYVDNTPSWVKQRVRASCKQYQVLTRVELAVSALREGVDPFSESRYAELSGRYITNCTEHGEESKEEGASNDCAQCDDGEKGSKSSDRAQVIFDIDSLFEDDI